MVWCRPGRWGLRLHCHLNVRCARLSQHVHGLIVPKVSSADAIDGNDGVPRTGASEHAFVGAHSARVRMAWMASACVQSMPWCMFSVSWPELQLLQATVLTPVNCIHCYQRNTHRMPAVHAGRSTTQVDTECTAQPPTWLVTNPAVAMVSAHKQMCVTAAARVVTGRQARVHQRDCQHCKQLLTQSDPPPPSSLSLSLSLAS